MYLCGYKLTRIDHWLLVTPSFRQFLPFVFALHRQPGNQKNNSLLWFWSSFARDTLKTPVPALDLRAFLDHEAALQA
jgi:hypothetical protein